MIAHREEESFLEESSNDEQDTLVEDISSIHGFHANDSRVRGVVETPKSLPLQILFMDAPVAVASPIVVVDQPADQARHRRQPSSSEPQQVSFSTQLLEVRSTTLHFMDLTSSFNNSKSEILAMMRDENNDLKNQKVQLKELTVTLMQ